MSFGNEELFDEVGGSPHALYRNDDPRELARQIGELERKVDSLGDEAEPRELLGAVAELRSLKTRYDTARLGRPANARQTAVDYGDDDDEDIEDEDDGWAPPSRGAPSRGASRPVSASANGRPTSAASARASGVNRRPMSASVNNQRPFSASSSASVNNQRPASAAASRSRVNNQRPTSASTGGRMNGQRGVYESDDDNNFVSTAPMPRRGNSSSSEEEQDMGWTAPASVESRRRPSSSRPRSALQTRQWVEMDSEEEEEVTLRRSRTTPLPFGRLEADIQDRQRRSMEREELTRAQDEEAKDAKEQSYRRAVAVPPGTGFQGVERHQQEQRDRANAKNAHRMAREEHERECRAFRANGPTREQEEPLAEQAMREVERGARIAQRAQNGLLSSTAPLSHSGHQRPRRQRAPAATTRKKATLDPAEVTRLNDVAHERWRRSLERSKRSGRSCTEPRDPLEARRVAAQQRTLERTAAKEKKEAELLEAQKRSLQDEVRRQKAARPTFREARQTYSTYLKAQTVRERQNEKRRAQTREMEIAQERAARQREVSRKLTSDMRSTDEDRNARLESSAALDAREAKKKFRADLKKNKAKYALAAENAPSLMSRLTIQTAKDKAKVAALKRISAALYGATKPADWKNILSGSDIFDEEDKIFLNIDDGDDANADEDYGDLS